MRKSRPWRYWRTTPWTCWPRCRSQQAAPRGPSNPGGGGSECCIYPLGDRRWVDVRCAGGSVGVVYPTRGGPGGGHRKQRQRGAGCGTTATRIYSVRPWCGERHNQRCGGTGGRGCGASAAGGRQAGNARREPSAIPARGPCLQQTTTATASAPAPVAPANEAKAPTPAWVRPPIVAVDHPMEDDGDNLTDRDCLDGRPKSCSRTDEEEEPTTGTERAKALVHKTAMLAATAPDTPTETECREEQAR